MIIPASTDGVRQYSIPQWVVPGILSAVAVLLLTITVTGVMAIRYSTVAHQLATQSGENAILRSQLDGLHANVSKLQKELASLEDSERRVRMVFGIPEIDPAERALGTGGSPATTDSNRFSPADYETFGVEARLDRLVRRCEFERDNFKAILTALTDRKNLLDRTPSIAPVTDGYLSRGFGRKPDPFTGQVRPHLGIDLAAPRGTPIRAAADGRVVSVRRQPKLGRVITIDHGDGIRTVYGHMSKFLVKPKAFVRRGDVIGLVGNSGYSTGPHVHYEVRVNGRAVNPMKYIYDFTPWISVPLASNDPGQGND